MYYRSSFINIGNYNLKNSHILFVLIILFFSSKNTSSIVFIIYQVRVAVFFVVIAMNIYIFKQFLPLSVALTHFVNFSVSQ